MGATAPPWVVTGVTRGIGRATCEALARSGDPLVLVARDGPRLQQTAAELNAVVPGTVVGTVTADLATRAGVRSAAEQIRAGHPVLKGLVNNAGGIFVRHEMTPDGFEHTFALNVLAPFGLSRLLAEPLARGHGRVVNIASAAHLGAHVDFSDLDGARSAGWAAYSRSKLELILLTGAFARRTPAETTAYFALHPGFVRSHFGLENGGAFAIGMRIGMTLGGISPKRAAATVLYAAKSTELTGKSGLYIAHQRVAQPSAAAQRAADGDRLWEELDRRFPVAS